MPPNKSLSTVSAAVFLIFLLSLVVPKPATAQEEFVPPPSKFITSVPFSILTGGVMIVHALLDDFKDTLNFVLDTGSGGISLDSTTCAYFNLKTEMSNRTVRGIAGIKTVQFTYNHTMHLPGLSVNNLDFHINDYDLLTSAYGMRIDGIIGYSFFRRYIILLDYDSSKAAVWTPGTFKYPRGGYMLRPQFSTLPMQEVGVRDNTNIDAKFYFDTGAGLCMLLNDDLVQDSSLFKKSRKLYPTEAEGLGGKKAMYMSVVKEVKLGPYHFRNVPVYVFDDVYNVTAYPILGGLIGNDILRRFNVILNYPDQQIYLKPNKHLTDSFDYSYTGLGIYLINGLITVTDIMKKSPAEEAGFKEDDIIMGVDNNFSGNIQIYKGLLQNAGSKVKIVITRNGKPLILTIKVKSIY